MKSVFKILLLCLMIFGIGSVGYSGPIEKDKTVIEKSVDYHFIQAVQAESFAICDVGKFEQIAIYNFNLNAESSTKVNVMILKEPGWHYCGTSYNNLKNDTFTAITSNQSNISRFRKVQHKC